MQLRHLQSITQPSEGIQKVTALCWAPNGKRLAVCTTERVVLMFDEDGIRKDKFSTKPADKGPKNYVVRQMTFSPQSNQLAIAQTDNIVFIYKLGSDWGDKKSICNKFPSTSPPTCLAWPLKRPNEIVYGLAEGSVKIGQLKSHKPTNLYQTDSYVTAMACNPRGNAVVSAHLDGSIYTYWFESSERGAHVIARHPSVPFSLAWGGSIVVAGNDRQITFYDEDGGEEGTFDHSNDVNCREFTAAASNPTGDAIVLGNYDSFYVYARNKDTMGWEEKSITHVENMYSVTTLGWKSDGSKLAVGTLCGIVDLYDVCLKRTMYKGGFELTYVSHSQVIVRHIESNIRVVVRSQYGLEIYKTNIYSSRYVIANTSKTLLLADLETLKVSEVEWHGDGTEKYIFDNSSACIIYYAGEVSIIEYGVNEFLGSIRTSHISSHVLSLRINERPLRSNSANGTLADDNKKVAFLLDAQTICIKDLMTQSTTIFNHDYKIDWLELNGRASLLLFRDKRRLLHLFNITTQVKTQLLNFCTYVQWVPNSDVVVAQNRNNLCVWYNINAPEQITMHTIKGDIEEIERLDGRTEVIVDEGMEQAVYPLDSALIEFGTAIDDHDFLHAMEVLEGLELTSESEAMWLQLSVLALEENEFRIAQRCQAAIGNVSHGKFLGKINKIKEAAEEEYGINGCDYYKVRTLKNLLNKNLKEAEDNYLIQGKVEECIDMYHQLYKYEEAIRVAEITKHPNTIEMRQVYYQYLLDSNQEEQAALLKEKEQDYQQAVNLYLKAGLPAKAAQVILNNNILQPTHLLENVTNSLIRGGMHDIAGDFYELLNDLQRAFDSYVRGHAYRKAVDLARRSFPGRVVELQEHWGDYLVTQKQIDMAINHYIEAKAFHKAIEAAMNARQFSRALQLVDAIDSESSRPYYKQLARYYEETSQYDLAERCYISAEQPQLAVEMHTKLGHWELAHKIATNYMNEGEVGLLYINQAQKLELERKFKEAEKMYLAVKERDLAINMYKKNRLFDDMIRLVQEQRPDLLKETHQFLAQTLEVEGSLREAEHHYVEAQEWHSAVNMYRSNELWDDAIRVAKFYGGLNACKRVTIALLMAIGVPEGSKYLIKHSLVEAAIEHASENGAFDMAFELATNCAPKKLNEIHLKHALFLEDDEQFQQAEEEFIKAGKPKEAIDMHVHQQDWSNALRVAEEYDPSAVSDVYVAHARSLCDSNDLKGAEDLFIAALHPELALSMYQEVEAWQDALRIAQLHLPHRVAEINIAYQSAQARSGKGGTKKDFLTTAKGWEQSKQWIQAIEAYLAARKDIIDSIEDLEDLWDRAIEIARNHVPNKYVEVAIEVSRRLIALGREETAADILYEIGRQDEAVTVCLTSKKFDKAKALAQGNAALKRRVDEAYQGHLVLQEDGTGELVELGRTDVALDVLAKRGDWDRVWEVATKEKLSQASLAKYVVMRCEQLLKGDALQVNEAVNLLNTKQGPANDTSIPFYHQLVFAVLSRSFKEEQMVDQPEVVNTLREVLFKIAKQYRGHAVDKQLPIEIEELLMATHYQSMYYLCLEHGLIDTAAKCSITLLKYPEIISSDKAFYQAGTTCRDQGNTNLAFLLLNRYVDLTEAIDTGDSSFLDNGDFQDADALPLNGPLPESHYLDDEDMREDVRTWVLSVVTDSHIEQKLPSREKSRNTLYDGLFSSDRVTCIVSGYPVYPADMLEINNSTANRKEWNALVSKTRTCPWTRQPQNPIY